MTPDEQKPVSAFHVFHRWTRWSEPKVYVCERVPVLGSESAITFSASWRGTLQYEIEEQRRTCIVCGAEQTRRV